MSQVFKSDQFHRLAQQMCRWVQSSIPFCVVRMPGSIGDGSYMVQSADDDADADICLRVKPWLAKQWLGFTNRNQCELPSMPVCRCSTAKQYYIESVASLSSLLGSRGGKTVLSRTICGEFHHFNDAFFCSTVEKFFNATVGNGALTFLFWHPNTNFWIGSTPELILERDGSGSMHTIALAGTMDEADTAPWSNKNIDEHRIVADYIQERLGGLSLPFHRAQMDQVTCGPVKHLRTSFTSESGIDLSATCIDEIVEALQPTPALAGYPRTDAIEDIDRIEQWPRHFYAGCISVAAADINLTYGIIRCAQFDPHGWCIYTGSGITADSDPADEWNETARKASTLLGVLS